MDKIDAVLTEDQLKRLRGAYNREGMTQVLSTGMPSLHKTTTKFIHTIRKAFYDNTTALAPKDRERCLIAVLSARDAGLNLAMHIYMGLMEGLTPHEIADVIFLGGIYTGVDRISDGLNAEFRTLTALSRAAGKEEPSVATVLDELVATFRPPEPSPG